MAKMLTGEKEQVEIEVVLGLVTQDNKALLTVRRESKLKEAHMRRQMPGGRPKVDEDYAKTAERETYEETGWMVKATEKLPMIVEHVWEYPDKIQKTLLHCYRCDLKRKGKMVQKMHQDADWIDINEALALDLMPGCKEFILHINKQN